MADAAGNDRVDDRRVHHAGARGRLLHGSRSCAWLVHQHHHEHGVTMATTTLPEPHWYIVHAYSNFEKKVADEIKKQAVSHGLAELFEEVLVPTEEVVEVRRGQKVNAERKFFPGYVLVK